WQLARTWGVADSKSGNSRNKAGRPDGAPFVSRLENSTAPSGVRAESRRKVEKQCGGARKSTPRANTLPPLLSRWCGLLLFPLAGELLGVRNLIGSHTSREG